MKGLTDIPGVLVGHASDYDGLTGCTAILCEGGAVAGGDIRGSATGTHEWDVLDPHHVTDRIHGVLLAGGSAFGLEAASGVMRYLEHKGVGFDTAGGKVPIVPAAILYDLTFTKMFAKKSARPTREMGEAAAAAATDKAVEEGCVGAGTGATVGKLFGMTRAMKAGIGSWTVDLEGPLAGVKVSALAAVNAVGDVVDPATGKIVAGARTAANSRDFANSAKAMKAGATSAFTPSNTTLVVVATNARLNKVEAGKLARLASLGVARAINPVNTMSDGDVVIALSVGQAAANVESVGVAAAEAVAESILRAVREARTLGGVPGLKR